MLERDHLLGFIVGDTRLQIHLFHPDVSRSHAELIEWKVAGLLDAMSSRPHEVSELQVCIPTGS